MQLNILLFANGCVLDCSFMALQEGIAITNFILHGCSEENDSAPFMRKLHLYKNHSKALFAIDDGKIIITIHHQSPRNCKQFINC